MTTGLAKGQTDPAFIACLEGVSASLRDRYGDPEPDSEEDDCE